METAPIYAFFAEQTEFAKRDLPGAAVVGPNLLAFHGDNLGARKRLLALLTFISAGAGHNINAATLFAAGALAGAAARAAAEYRGAEEIARSAGLESLLSEPDGAWMLKELAIWQMVKSLSPGSLSIWRIILGGIMHDGAPEIPNIDAVCKATMDARGTGEWGLAFSYHGHRIHDDAFSYASKLWPVARFILKENIKNGTAAVEVACAAQTLLTKGKAAVALDVGARLVMQAAVVTATDESLARHITEIGLLPGSPAPG